MVIIIYPKSWMPYIALILGIIFVLSPFYITNVYPNANVPLVFLLGVISIVIGILGIDKQKEKPETHTDWTRQKRQRKRDFKKTPDRMKIQEENQQRLDKQTTLSKDIYFFDKNSPND